MQLQAYMLSSKPAIPEVTADTVRGFARKFLDHFEFPESQRNNVSSAFDQLAKKLDNTPFDAAEHAEATIMALAYANKDGTVTTDPAAKFASTLQSIFQANPVPVGISKKCCFCCHKLASLPEQRAGLKFALQGTHSTVFPWIPPAGLPYEVLVELRLALLRVMYDTVNTAVAEIIRSAQTSPSADSVSPVDDLRLPKVDVIRYHLQPR
ncbi:hypothetical protein L226DRAFT_538364 [Lentinus tigrinus ALCF2SS1-7]|uniref:Uncharacterized protein n=1 Tax=Lentinus tigrinus ALCF2SS1-6 TaxID=1328759 RepID=A0A5C2RZ00_9APHY|nr:hypothetical protein L227DRAFT_578932 [Lentinus tigrinus ALCF2SS1-6]RPD70986.1 hypothetical protein L226DRAFT_538364 [Lentinus tigrinus ALCF2SS1-7]